MKKKDLTGGEFKILKRPTHSHKLMLLEWNVSSQISKRREPKSTLEPIVPWERNVIHSSPSMSQDARRSFGVPSHYLSVITEKISNMLNETVTLIIIFLAGKASEGFRG